MLLKLNSEQKLKLIKCNELVQAKLNAVYLDKAYCIEELSQKLRNREAQIFHLEEMVKQLQFSLIREMEISQLVALDGDGDND